MALVNRNAEKVDRLPPPGACENPKYIDASFALGQL